MTYNNLINPNPDGIRQVLTQEQFNHYSNIDFSGTTEGTEPPVGFSDTVAGKPYIL